MLDAQADLEEKKIDNDRARLLFAKDEVSAQDRDLAATALKRAEAIFKAAQQRYNEAVEGSRKEDVAIAQANLKEAGANLGLSRINLDYTILHAPSTGVITVRQAELGEVVAPGTPVITLADLDHIWLRAYIAETDLGKIHWGQEATVTTDTYPGKRYRGRISFISSSAEFTPKSVQTYTERVTLVYRIKIDIDNPNHELKPACPPMPASIWPRPRRKRIPRRQRLQSNDGSTPTRDRRRWTHEKFSRRARRGCAEL